MDDDDIVIVSTRLPKKNTSSNTDCQILSIKKRPSSAIEVVSSRVYTRPTMRFGTSSARFHDIIELNSPAHSHTHQRSKRNRPRLPSTDEVIDLEFPSRMTLSSRINLDCCSPPDSTDSSAPTTSAITAEIMNSITSNPKPRKAMVQSILPPLQPDPPLQPQLAMVKCTICLEFASSKTALGSTVCGHVFCEDCFKQSQKSSKYCPNCRKKMGKNSYHKLFL